MALDFKSGSKDVSVLTKRVSQLSDEIHVLRAELKTFQDRVQKDMVRVVEQLNRK